MKNKTIKNQIIIIYLISFFIVVISLYLSFVVKDWQWFSRSGSLIVVLGIYLTSNQIIENSHRLRQRYRGAHKEGNFKRDWAGEKQQKILRHAREHEEETWVMGQCGFNVLIAGTLIWGFGDLLSFF
jgi:hypothetical protein